MSQQENTCVDLDFVRDSLGLQHSQNDVWYRIHLNNATLLSPQMLKLFVRPPQRIMIPPMAIIIVLGNTIAFTICPSEVASFPKVSEIVSG